MLLKDVRYAVGAMLRVPSLPEGDTHSRACLSALPWLLPRFRTSGMSTRW
jgi:hypothetical protein